MAGKPIEYYLKKLEEYRTREDKSRSEMADELGISLGTYRNWYRGKNRNSPSSKHTKWINNFLATREIISVDEFLEKDGPDLLERIGFEKGQSVLDFGSGRGDYSLILARIVGKEGKVYAIDKNREALGELMGRARGNGLRNIEAKFVPAKTEPPTEILLPNKSIDAGWFSDILHDGYFKKDEEKEELLRDVYRILKEEGFIAIHPVHMEEKKLKRVIKSTGFYLEEEYREVVLFHGNEFHEGQIFKFEKIR